MSEHKEIAPLSPENNRDSVAEAAAEQKERLASSPEKSVENELSTNAERSNVEALFAKEHAPTERKKASLDASAPIKKLPKTSNRQARDASYKQTMSHVTSEMSPHERAFSKVIHNPAVEKTSEVVGATVARPNAILTGSFTAFLAVTIIYVVARNMGYQLSGFETIGAFLFGWMVGLIFDYVRVLISGRIS